MLVSGRLRLIMERVFQCLRSRRKLSPPPAPAMLYSGLPSRASYPSPSRPYFGIRPFRLMPTRAAHGCRQWLGCGGAGVQAGKEPAAIAVGGRQRDVAEQRHPAEADSAHGYTVCPAPNDV
jgi:hypothetical protein